MADDPAHKAMLYFLEVLMNNSGPLSISQLAGRFGGRAFSADMRTASGGNEVGLRKFLLRYPSLFTVNGNLVSLNESGTAPPTSTPPASTTNQTTVSRHSTDLSIETEAVLFFQGKLAKKEEKWVQIKSLAGHLSQANADIRQCVGPQNEFKKFLLRHLHVFEVQGELVSLRDSFSSASRKFDKTAAAGAPKSPAARPRNLKFVTRSHSSPLNPIKTPTGTPAIPVIAQTPTPTTGKPAPMTMTANEYKAVMFLKNIVETRGAIKLHNLTGHFSQAPDGVRNTIGWTKMELEEFVLKNQNIFSIDEDELVTVKKAPKMHVIITGSRPQRQSVQTLTARKGKVFHVAKLWGIIDLGKHEHVFFDKSIYPKEIDDFQKEFAVGEILNFNAVLAPKESRAKWRATQVWRDGETAASMIDFTAAHGLDGITSPTTSIEEELRQLLPNDYDKFDAEFLQQLKDDPFTDAAPSGTGSVPVWNRKLGAGKYGQTPTTPTITMVPENYFMYASSMEDVHNILSDYVALPDPSDAGVSPTKGRPTFMLNENGNASDEDAEDDGNVCNGDSASRKMISVACQTMSTGEILATQFYHEGLLKETAGMSVV
ncbi:uncharacterized protein LOC141901800 [Tubulanus polymorphus]|uniref:uncharacterized protein LOC141901800 n=1 Tax=Tubulanus polymorphus TaxID=672921 RepID=UPI003DA4F312